MTDQIRILLVDDQQLIRLGFRLVLEAEHDLLVVAEAADGVEAIAAAREHAPDIVLMDVRMPRLDGIAATTAIIAERPEARVLVLTTFDLDEYAFAALRAGASGFLLKDAQARELVDAIRSVHRGDATLSPRVTRRMLQLFGDHLPSNPPSGSPAGDAKADSGYEKLTARERDVLVAMAAGHSNLEIAAALFLSESTVKTHVGRVLAKLGARDRVQAVILAYQLRIVEL